MGRPGNISPLLFLLRTAGHILPQTDSIKNIKTDMDVSAIGKYAPIPVGKKPVSFQGWRYVKSTTEKRENMKEKGGKGKQKFKSIIYMQERKYRQTR
jgi:hypothetical protein